MVAAAAAGRAVASIRERYRGGVHGGEWRGRLEKNSFSPRCARSTRLSLFFFPALRALYD